MNYENKFKDAYYKALGYAKINWNECEDGFSEIIELENSWFFGRNKSKSGLPIIDNLLGVIISKQDLSLKPCFGGTKEHLSLEKGKLLDIPNDYVKQNVEEYMNKIIDDYEPTPLTEEDKEFEKYCKLYEEKFGKQAYIAEPSGTKEKTIEAIKTCLEKNEDLLDKILYPNFDEDIEDGNLY